MAAQADTVQFLRFLTQEGKVPLALALPKCNLLRQKGLIDVESIARCELASLIPIFGDDKVAKQVHNAAKKKSNPKKRSAPDISGNSNKQAKIAPIDEEEELAFPISELSIDEIRSQTIETNRAPLFLAFSVTVAKYTLPDQPLSSRLSLAQAVTSAGAQSKARYIGLTDSTAEDEGWAQGQPKIRLMGRDIAVMRRHVAAPILEEESDSQKTVDADLKDPTHEAFWGIDLEALKKSNGPLVAGKSSHSTGPPIHNPKAARAYILKSIDLVDIQDEEILIKSEDSKSPKKPKKLTPAEKTSRKENAAVMLLKAIDHVCQSWSSTLSAEDLDRRAVAWYNRTRPRVKDGKPGWGQKGQVPLRDILNLAKDP